MAQIQSSPPGPKAPSTSAPKFKARGSVFNPRTITAPIAAITMALLLYTYSVTSIRAAKRNAQLHREADGGQLDMRRESLRRHGALDQVEGTKNFELFRGARADAKKEREFLNERKARPFGVVGAGKGEGGEGGVGVVGPRTEVEGGLEGYKGRGNLVRRLKEEQQQKEGG